MAALMHAYVTSDFSVANVAENSHTDKPLLYKIAGAWGNHEGSMLLWVFMLTGYGAAARRCSAATCRRRLRARVLAVQGMIGLVFLLFILLRLQPLPAHLAGRPSNGPLAQSAAAGPGLALPSAVPLLGLRRLLGGLLASPSPP